MVKSYPIERSLLYRLRNKRKLARILKVPNNYFNSNKYFDDIKYREFIVKKGLKDRLICDPHINLKIIQTNLLKLLVRIETPHWLTSGKKGSSYITNAQLHGKLSYVYTIDIENFYPSCKLKYIYQMFISSFKMSPDIARILTNIVSYNGCLPTGAPTSPLISFWTYNKVFNQIANNLNKKDMIFSLYIDDMTISSNKPIPKQLIRNISKDLAKVELRLKISKINYYRKSDFKIITGVAISPTGELRVPNKRRKRVIDDYNKHKNLTIEYTPREKLSLIGRVRSARQIEAGIFPEVMRQVIKPKDK